VAGNRSDENGSLDAGAEKLRRFRYKTARKIREWGGAVLDTDGTVVFAAFGFPFGRPKGSVKNPLELACAFALAYSAEAGPSYSFGLDYGSCACLGGGGWGLSAFGPPVVRSRILSGLAPRYGAAILLPKTCADQLPGVVEKKLLGTLEDKQGGPGIPFVELIDWKSEALDKPPENSVSLTEQNS
jgi:class 3 adenylate cyclase